MTQSNPTTQTERPRGVPDTARLVTLAQLADEVAGEDGTLRIGKAASNLRCEMRIFPFGLRGQVKRITSGVSKEHGGRVFGLTYCHGTRRGSTWRIMAFTAPGAADRPLWVWELEQERAWIKAGRP
jgi:hypothetical protein